MIFNLPERLSELLCLASGSVLSLFATSVKVVVIQGWSSYASQYLSGKMLPCFMNSRATAVVSALFVLVVILLFSSPRGDTQRSDIEAEIEVFWIDFTNSFYPFFDVFTATELKIFWSQGYDGRVTQRALMMSSMALAIVSALSALGAFHILSPVYAKTIDGQSVVLHHFRPNSWHYY